MQDPEGGVHSDGKNTGQHFYTFTLCLHSPVTPSFRKVMSITKCCHVHKDKCFLLCCPKQLRQNHVLSGISQKLSIFIITIRFQ